MQRGADDARDVLVWNDRVATTTTEERLTRTQELLRTLVCRIRPCAHIAPLEIDIRKAHDGARSKEHQYIHIQTDIHRRHAHSHYWSLIHLIFVTISLLERVDQDGQRCCVAQLL